jgi:hypothetical protein
MSSVTSSAVKSSLIAPLSALAEPHPKEQSAAKVAAATEINNFPRLILNPLFIIFMGKFAKNRCTDI